MIKCPECGKEISSKAQSCIGCGCPMEVILSNTIIDEISCPECGSKIESGLTTCPNCGCPASIIKELQSVQQEEKAKEEQNQKKEAKRNAMSNMLDEVFGANAFSTIHRKCAEYVIYHAFTHSFNKQLGKNMIYHSDKNREQEYAIVDDDLIFRTIKNLVREGKLAKHSLSDIAEGAYFVMQTGQKVYSLEVYSLNNWEMDKMEERAIELFMDYERTLPPSERTLYVDKKNKDINYIQEEAYVEGKGSVRSSSMDRLSQIPSRGVSLKCPICNSGNVVKIGNVSRAVSVGVFGLASSSIGKTMECKSCGYKF